MLNGIDPVLIFQIRKLGGGKYSELLKKVSILATETTFIDMPPVPIYLSESLTGLYIDTEDKNTDIETDTETKTNGETPEVDQKGTGSTVSINMIGVKGSVGITLLSAMIDQIFDKVTSKEYSVTYMHGATTVFRGYVSGFQISQNANETKYQIKLDITKGQKQPKEKTVGPTAPKTTGTEVLTPGPK